MIQIYVYYFTELMEGVRVKANNTKLQLEKKI